MLAFAVEAVPHVAVEAPVEIAHPVEEPVSDTHVATPVVIVPGHSSLLQTPHSASSSSNLNGGVVTLGVVAVIVIVALGVWALTK